MTKKEWFGHFTGCMLVQKTDLLPGDGVTSYFRFCFKMIAFRREKGICSGI